MVPDFSSRWTALPRLCVLASDHKNTRTFIGATIQEFLIIFMMDKRGCMHLNRFETFRIKPVSRWGIQYYSLSHFIWRQLNEIYSPWRYILTVCDRLEVLFFSNCSWQILFCCRFYVLPPPGLITFLQVFYFTHTYTNKLPPFPTISLPKTSGMLQSLFDGFMYIFFFVWTPALGWGWRRSRQCKRVPTGRLIPPPPMKNTLKGLLRHPQRKYIALAIFR